MRLGNIPLKQPAISHRKLQVVSLFVRVAARSFSERKTQVSFPHSLWRLPGQNLAGTCVVATPVDGCIVLIDYVVVAAGRIAEGLKFVSGTNGKSARYSRAPRQLWAESHPSLSVTPRGNVYWTLGLVSGKGIKSQSTGALEHVFPYNRPRCPTRDTFSPLYDIHSTIRTRMSDLPPLYHTASLPCPPDLPQYTQRAAEDERTPAKAV